ncbi:MAG TPA: hypothetical protein VM938_00455 [Acidimicrobiales bacterium]|nr:hypothetical protein [Acidimicrobiales bacterium]
MSPRQKLAPRTVVVLSLTAVAFAGVLLFMVVNYASQNPGDANLGSDVVTANAEVMAKRIAETGPRAYQDPRGERHVYLQHTGDDPQRGWVLILAQAPDGCAVLWDVKRDVFEAPCTKRTYPADGTGLTTYPAPVENGRVVIDLRGG